MLLMAFFNRPIAVLFAADHGVSKAKACPIASVLFLEFTKKTGCNGRFCVLNLEICHSRFKMRY